MGRRSIPVLPLLVCGALVLVYLLVRLALLYRFPSYVDEALYADFTARGYANRADLFASLTIGKEPLLQWLGIGWMKLGAGQLTAVRLVSLVSGLATMAFLGLLARHLAGNRAGVAAAALAALLPFSVVVHSIGLEEPLTMAGLTGALYFQVRVAESPRLDLALLMGLAMAVAVFTKETGRFAVVLLPFSLLLFDWRPRDRWRRLARWAGCAALGVGMAYAAYSLMRLSPLWETFNQVRETGEYPVRSLSEALDDPIGVFDANWPDFREALSGYVTLPLLFAAAVGAGLLLRERPPAGGLLATWLLAMLAGAVFFPYDPFPRYVFYTVPPIAVFAAIALARITPAVIRPSAWARGLRLDRVAELPAVRAVEADDPRGHGLRAGIAAGAVALICLPAVVLDVSVLSDPETAEYPSLDDVQYVTGTPAGTEWPELVDETERIAAAGAGPVVVRVHGVARRSLEPFLSRGSPVRFVGGGTPEGDAAPYIVQNGQDLAELGLPPEELRALRLVREFPRPRGGVPVRLLRRGG